MYDVYYWTTPNAHKVTIFLEEIGAEYQLVPVDIRKGDQFKPEFLAISPNNRIPALVDRTPAHSDQPLALFESGAILLYLADKIGCFIAEKGSKRWNVIQWLFWQMAGLGPMLGQNHHFAHYAPEKIPYAIARYKNETSRLYRVLNEQLSKNEFIAGDYSIADMACYPWIVLYERQGMVLREFPALKKWFETIRLRPAVERAYAKAKGINTAPTVDAESRKWLFGQK